MEEYVRISLETHLFFARIMKEHGFFLEAGFLKKDNEWMRRAAMFRHEFETLLRQAIRMGNGLISGSVLCSEELVTTFTERAEAQTSSFTGIAIDSGITRMEQSLHHGRMQRVDTGTVRAVEELNRRALALLGDFIRFKENILNQVKSCRLFTTNYPLLIEHIIREARLYRDTIKEIMSDRRVCRKKLKKQENFWNRIMMEHALFIRGLLDPTEEKLILAADEFAMDFEKLLRMANEKDCRAMEGLSRQSLEATKKIKEFKTAGTEGILDCQIESLILPLLADHVLREASHYLRILESGYDWKEER